MPVHSHCSLVVSCQRIDCDAVDLVELGAFDMAAAVADRLPDGWGWDFHDGVNPAIHCPAHRRAPSAAEVEAIYRARAE